MIMISDEIKYQLVAQDRGTGDLGEVGSCEEINSTCDWSEKGTDAASYGTSTVIGCTYISSDANDPLVITNASTTTLSITGEYGLATFNQVSYKFKDINPPYELFTGSGWPPPFKTRPPTDNPDLPNYHMYELIEDPRTNRDVTTVVEFLIEFDFSSIATPPALDIATSDTYNLYVDTVNEKAYRKDRISFVHTVRNYSFIKFKTELLASLSGELIGKTVLPDAPVVEDPVVEDPVPSEGAIYVPTGYSYVWGDLFNADELDATNWFVGMRDPDTGDLVPGAGGDYLLNNKYSGYVTEEDSFVEDGSLILRNQKRSYTGTSPAGNYAYTSGWVTSMHRRRFNKGYIEVRAKFPSGDKVWPAIWMVAEDLVWGPEWDLWEYFGYRSDVGYDNMGMHLMTGYQQHGNMWPNQDAMLWDDEWIKPFDTNYDAEAWHIYGWEWTDTYAQWSIDGNVVHTLLKSQTRNPSAWPNEEMYIILNNGVRTASPDTTTTWPNTLEIDYIEVYQKPPDINYFGAENGDILTAENSDSIILEQV